MLSEEKAHSQDNIHGKTSTKDATCIESFSKWADIAEDNEDNEDNENCTSHKSNSSEQKSVYRKGWTHDEIEELHYMSFHGHSLRDMMYEFKRSRKSIIRALRRIQVQQALFHPLNDVATAHNMDTKKLLGYIQDPLYYVPLPVNEVPRLLIAATVLFGVVASYGYIYFQ